MKILIYTDPHLEASREAHTTLDSSHRLRERIYEEMQKIFDIEADFRICLGDLFDRYSNSEDAIDRARQVVEETDIILAGNHDLINRESKIGSLQLLSCFYHVKFLVNGWGEHESICLDRGNTRMTFVPHVASQELFDKALDDAKESNSDYPGWKVLCLHCNYDRDYTEGTETALNLSREQAEDLLRHFHKIYLGHEHHPVSHYDDRLVLIGNVYPTSFSDLSDKRVLIYDTEDGSHTSHSLSSREDLGWSGKASQLKEEMRRPFMTVEDDLEPGKTNRIITGLFKDPGVFAVRLTKQEAEKERQEVVLEKLETLPELVSKELEAQPKLKLWWDRLYEEEQAQS